MAALATFLKIYFHFFSWNETLKYSDGKSKMATMGNGHGEGHYDL